MALGGCASGFRYTYGNLFIPHPPPVGYMTVNIIRYDTAFLPTPVVGTQMIFDLFKDLSMQDRKYHQYTTNDGHLRGILANITLEISGDSSELTDFQIWGAPNSWAVRNAVRRFHFERLEMYERNGIDREELGAYARTIRPWLDNGHYSSKYVDDLLPTGANWDETTEAWSIAQYTGGQWPHSDFVSAPGTVTFDVSGVVATPKFTDKWNLSLVGDHVVQATSDAGDEKWACVSAVRSYIDARGKPLTPRDNSVGDPDQVIQGTNNPLLQLSSGDISSSMVTEEAESESEWAPPYELAPNDASRMESKGIGSLQGSQTRIFKFNNVFLPGGFLLYDSKSVYSFSEMTVEVLGLAECREYSL